MDTITLLVQHSIAAGQASSPGGSSPIDTLWHYVTTLGIVESLTFISFGVVWLFYGWRVFKILVTICFSLLGLFAGVYVHRELIGGEVLWLSVLFMAMFGFLAVWFMKWAVSLLGAAAGAILTSGIWLACGLPQNIIWAGALVGFVAGGMLSFVVFKAAVMLFTCLGGSVLTVTGLLAILHNRLESGNNLHAMVYGQRWFLPIMMAVPMVVGMIAQYKLMKGEECSL
ncbi:hypothetical protein ACFL6U_05195 [Planctomycetota bacterium]